MKIASVLGLTATGCLLAAMVVAAADEEIAPTTEPVHTDPEKVQAGLIEGVLGFVNGDLEQVRTGLAAIEDGCRRVAPAPEVPSEVSGYDRAFHTALTRTRELAARGDYDRSFEQFFWIQKGCLECHRRATEHGLREGPQPPDNTDEPGVRP